MKYLIENCANSAESCAMAQKGGADRVELCAGIPEGGTTPSYGEMKKAREILTTTRLNVIIRPRGGDFLYTDNELDIMETDIETAKSIGADGVVFGCLTAEGYIDKKAMQRLMKAADGLSVTFHRAFDVCREPLQALEDIIALGCDRILTSGQCGTAFEGMDMIKELVGKAGDRIIIMPGCGVNKSNIRQIALHTGAKEFHMSARSTIKSGMTYHNERVSMGGTVHIAEYERDLTDPEKIARIKSILHSL